MYIYQVCRIGIDRSWTFNVWSRGRVSLKKSTHILKYYISQKNHTCKLTDNPGAVIQLNCACVNMVFRSINFYFDETYGTRKNNIYHQDLKKHNKKEMTIYLCHQPFFRFSVLEETYVLLAWKGSIRFSWSCKKCDKNVFVYCKRQLHFVFIRNRKKVIIILHL